MSGRLAGNTRTEFVSKGTRGCRVIDYMTVHGKNGVEISGL